MSRVDLSPEAIARRLRAVDALSSLAPERRLEGKLDLSPAGVSRRLREASDLLALCRSLRRVTPRG